MNTLKYRSWTNRIAGALLTVVALLIGESLRAGLVAEPPEQRPIWSTTISTAVSVKDSTYRRVIKNGTESMSCYLNYPQGSARVMPGFSDNAVELQKLDEFLRRVFRDTLIYVGSIQLTGYCSIEGAYDLNERLAKNRAMGFKSYLDTEYELSARYPVQVDWVAEDWDKLRRMVNGSGMEYKNEVLFLIDNTDLFEGREKRLMDMAGGDPYKYMLREFFPGLRRVEITVDYDLHRIIEEKLQRKLTNEEFEAELVKERAAAAAEEQRLADEAAAQQQEAARFAAAEAARVAAEAEALRAAALQEAQRRAEEAARLEAQRKQAEAVRVARLQKQERRKLHPLVAVKTNLLYWAGLMPDFKMRTFTPNLEAEVYFAGRWSAIASGAYAHWEYNGKKDFWGVSSYSAEPRFWIRNNGLFRGFYAGVYGQAGDFDVQQDCDETAVTYTNYTGTFWGAGLSVGYLVSLSRHWGLEVNLRGGYRSAQYDVYDREMPSLYYNRSDKENGFTLTGIKLNAVYRFGRP